MPPSSLPTSPHRPPPPHPAGCRARLHPAGPARHPALRRRGAAGQALTELSRRDTGAPSTSSTSPPPGCTSRTWRSSLRPPPPGRRGQHRHRHRAQPGRGQDRDWIIDLGPDGGDAGARWSRPVPGDDRGRAPERHGVYLRRSSAPRNGRPSHRPERPPRRRPPAAPPFPGPARVPAGGAPFR